MKFSNFIFILITNIVLCGNAFSQSTFFLEEDSAQLSPLYMNRLVHGFGMESLSAYDPSGSFDKACQQALQDLNSNQFLSVYLEAFQKSDQNIYRFPELSVRDTVLTFNESIVKLDSLQVEDQAVCVAGLEEGQSEFATPIPDVYELMLRPQKVGNTWFAVGKSEATSFNRSFSWMKAKNYAIKELTKVLRTSVQSMDRQLEENEYILRDGITYFKSNLVFNNIHNLQRYTTDNLFIVVIAVDQDDVIEY